MKLGLLSSALFAHAFSNLAMFVVGTDLMTSAPPGCCPPGVTAKMPINGCSSFYQCAHGKVVPGHGDCAEGTAFDGSFCVASSEVTSDCVFACPTAHWVACGRPGKCGKTDGISAVNDEVYAVRCCSSDKKSGWAKKNGCDVYAEPKYATCPAGHAASTFEDAQNICYNMGARLCTREEMDGGCTRGQGCRGLNNDLIWTSDTA